MIKPPGRSPGTRLCLCLTGEGLTVYGNNQSFAALAEHMRWLAKSDTSEHFECHVRMSLESEASLFEGKRPRSAGVLFAKELAKNFRLETENYSGFELTFMVAAESDLDELAKYQDEGLLPDTWNSGE